MYRHALLRGARLQLSDPNYLDTRRWLDFSLNSQHLVMRGRPPTAGLCSKALAFQLIRGVQSHYLRIDALLLADMGTESSRVG